jgi:hypothetical protein
MARSLSKKVRFDIFKRDLFVCQYCGRKPPAVVLEVDHVIPVSGGGSSDEHNLLTSCFDCNRGKAAGTLTANPIDIEGRRQRLEERREQAAAYEELLQQQRIEQDAAIDDVISIYEAAFDGWTLLDSTRPSIRRFLSELPKMVVMEAMEFACHRMARYEKPNSGSAAFKYFCGVCWRKIKGD